MSTRGLFHLSDRLFNQKYSSLSYHVHQHLLLDELTFRLRSTDTYSSTGWDEKTAASTYTSPLTPNTVPN